LYIELQTIISAHMQSNGGRGNYCTDVEVDLTRLRQVRVKHSSMPLGSRDKT